MLERVIVDNIQDEVQRDCALMLWSVLYKSVSLYSEKAVPAIVSELHTHILVTLTVKLHENACWRSNAAVLTPMLQAFSRSILVTGWSASQNLSIENQTRLAGNLYAQAFSTFLAMLSVFVPSDKMPVISKSAYTIAGVVS